MLLGSDERAVSAQHLTQRFRPTASLANDRCLNLLERMVLARKDEADCDKGARLATTGNALNPKVARSRFARLTRSEHRESDLSVVEALKAGTNGRQKRHSGPCFKRPLSALHGCYPPVPNGRCPH